MSSDKIPLEKILKTLPSTAKIVAVSKKQNEKKIRELFDQGQRIFAENYVQEALLKQFILGYLIGTEWHFIGKLQKNKVKLIVGKFSLIHSVDSLDLAELIGKKSHEAGLTQKILLQINLAEEATKGGFSKSEFLEKIDSIKKIQGLEVVGLMTMPPLFENPEAAKPYFLELKSLADQHHLKELSMGTSTDYQVAAKCGATLVRLGTILFGERTK
jgi:pyridoxal phosphate enzyme (YggS family)